MMLFPPNAATKAVKRATPVIEMNYLRVRPPHPIAAQA
jgi:hypothetical protein